MSQLSGPSRRPLQSEPVSSQARDHVRCVESLPRIACDEAGCSSVTMRNNVSSCLGYNTNLIALKQRQKQSCDVPAILLRTASSAMPASVTALDGRSNEGSRAIHLSCNENTHEPNGTSERVSNQNDDIDDTLRKLQGPGHAAEKARILALQDGSEYPIAEAVQMWLDKTPCDVYKRKMTRLLTDITTMSRQFPSELFVSGVTLQVPYAVGGGGCADVFMGSLNGQLVALKRLRINGNAEQADLLHRKFCKEGMLWRQLRHRNILPFIGIDKETFKKTATLAIVSPWMSRGAILEYVCSDEYQPALERPILVIDMAEGLTFLHSEGITHGDLHAANVLITPDGHACIADFGLSVVGDADLTRTHQPTATGSASPTRWLAPELVSELDLMLPPKKKSADVFSFGRLCLSVCTGKRPFDLQGDYQVLLGLAKDTRPLRPTEAECGGHRMSDVLWNLANNCWAMEPADRPIMPNVLAELHSSYHMLL